VRSARPPELAAEAITLGNPLCLSPEQYQLNVRAEIGDWFATVGVGTSIVPDHPHRAIGRLVLGGGVCLP